MKPKKQKVNGGIPTDQLNLSIHREILRIAGDLVSAMIVEYICYRFDKNDNKKVWLKTDWIHKAVPFVSRAAIAKKLKKLSCGSHPLIQKEKGQRRHYHKCWYTPSSQALAAYRDETIGMLRGKVYYNKGLAEQNLEASVIFATILSLLKIPEGIWERSEYGRVENKLILDTNKLKEGTGLTMHKVRSAINWLIHNKKIDAKKTFGNKWVVTLPKMNSLDQSPTESFLHEDADNELPTECFPHDI